MYEIVVDILSWIRQETGTSLPEYCSVLSCFVPRGIYTNYCPKIMSL